MKRWRLLEKKRKYKYNICYVVNNVVNGKLLDSTSGSWTTPYIDDIKKTGHVYLLKNIEDFDDYYKGKDITLKSISKL